MANPVSTEEMLRHKFETVIGSLVKGDYYDCTRWGLKIEKGDEQLKIEVDVRIFGNKYTAMIKRDFEPNVSGLNVPVTKAFFKEIRQRLEKKILTIQ